MTDTSASESRLRLGVVGYGAAARMMLDSLATYGQFDIVGAVDTDDLVRKAFTERWGAPAFSSLADLLRAAPCDAAYLATPTKFHETHALAALDAGLHVLVEKPMAQTLESGQRMIAAARHHGRLLLENHKRSVDRPIIVMSKLIEAGLLGRVRAVHRWHFSSWFYRPRAPEERDPEVGGIVLRQGAHEFDIIRLLGQAAPSQVWGWTGDYDRDRGGEGSYQATVGFEGGLRATSIYSGYDHFDSDEFTLGLSDASAIGRVRRRSLEQAETVDEGETKRHTIAPPATGNGPRPSEGLFGFTLVNGEEADARPSPGGNVFLYGVNGRVEYGISGPAGTDLIAQEFNRAITEGIPALHDGRWGLAVLELCLAVRRSAALGGAPIALSHQYDVPTRDIARVIGSREPEPLTPLREPG